MLLSVAFVLVGMVPLVRVDDSIADALNMPKLLDFRYLLGLVVILHR